MKLIKKMSVDLNDYLFAAQLLKFMMVERPKWRPSLALILKNERRTLTKSLEEKIRHTMTVNNFHVKYNIWFEEREFTFESFRKLIELVTADFSQRDFDHEEFLSFCTEIATLGYCGYLDGIEEAPDQAVYCILHVLRVFREMGQFDDSTYARLDQWANSVMKTIEKHSPSSPLYSDPADSPSDSVFSSDMSLPEMDSDDSNQQEFGRRLSLDSIQRIQLEVNMNTLNVGGSKIANQKLPMNKHIDKLEYDKEIRATSDTSTDSEISESDVPCCSSSLLNLRPLKRFESDTNFTAITNRIEMNDLSKTNITCEKEESNTSHLANAYNIVNTAKEDSSLFDCETRSSEPSTSGTNQNRMISLPFRRLQSLSSDQNIKFSFQRNAGSKLSVCRSKSLNDYHIQVKNECNDSDEDKAIYISEPKDKSLENSESDYTEDKSMVYRQITPRKARSASEKNKLEVLSSPQGNLKASPNPKPLKRLKSNPGSENSM